MCVFFFSRACQRGEVGVWGGGRRGEGDGRVVVVVMVGRRGEDLMRSPKVSAPLRKTIKHE